MQSDTIVAISTPLGESGIGIVRLSGSRAIEMAEDLFVPSGINRNSLSTAPSHTLNYGFIVAQGRRIDEVLVSVMRAPRTYTREDVVEINCHGGILAVRAVLELLLDRGARLAEPGEFTKRAFLNGRLSLDQAKSVLDVVRAKTRLGLEAAVAQLGGRLSREIASLRDAIGGILAEIEVGIDYPDLESESHSLREQLLSLSRDIASLMEKGKRGRIVSEGLAVAIIGRPNVGKSTLLNAILAEERAIVTPVPGTTRDTVEEAASIDGIPVRFIDTAGLSEPSDIVEEEGVRRTKAAIERADLLLLLVDRSEPLSVEDRKLLETSWERPTLLAVNKCDLPPAIENLGEGSWISAHEISANSGDGVGGLLKSVIDCVLGGRVIAQGRVLLLDTWEQDLLRRAKGHLDTAVSSLTEGRTEDIVAEELRAAYVVVGELQGIDVSEDILSQVFSGFCVGK